MALLPFIFRVLGLAASSCEYMSAVVAPAAAYPDTMHFEAEESKEGTVWIWLRGPRQVLRRNVEVGRRGSGPDGSLKVSDGHFVRSECAFAAGFRATVPNTLLTPRPFKGEGGRVRPGSASPLNAAF